MALTACQHRTAQAHQTARPSLKFGGCEVCRGVLGCNQGGVSIRLVHVQSAEQRDTLEMRSWRPMRAEWAEGGKSVRGVLNIKARRQA